MRRLVPALLLTLATAAMPALAQTVVDGTESIAFDRPEAWAQKYFTSVTALSGFGAPRASRPGSVAIAFEVAQVPRLSREQRTVGFNGTKEEDLNRTPLFGRLRVDVGLPHAMTLTVGYTPPIELDGAKPNLLALALGRPVLERDAVRLGLRLHGEIGTIDGDFTCSEAVVAAGDDPERNPFGCERPSEDTFRTRYLGLELAASFPLRDGAIEPFVSASLDRLDTEFRVDARYSGTIDRTRLETRGFTESIAAGVDFALAPRWRLSGELHYTPLAVVRPPDTSSRDDGLFDARALLRFELR